MRFLLLLAALLTLAPWSLEAQVGPYTNSFVVHQEKSMSTNAVVITVQQPASGGTRRVKLDRVGIECDSATRFVIDLNCSTRATETAATVTATDENQRNATFTADAFIDSDAASCTTVESIIVPADTHVVYETNSIALPGAAGDYSFTLRSDEVASGTCYTSLWISQP